MAILDDVLARLNTIIAWQNAVVTNSKTTEELAEMTVVDRDGLIRVALGVSSKKLTIQTLIDEIASELALGNVPASFRIINIDFDAPGSDQSKVVDAINAIPNYVLSQGTLYFFYTNRIVLTNGEGSSVDPTSPNYAIIQSYYVLTQRIEPDELGVASIGIDGTDVLLNGIRYFHSLDNRSFETTEFDLGNIAEVAIDDAVDTSGPYSTPNGATILFRALQGAVGVEVAKLWLYTGDQEQIGLGEPPTDALTDYRLFPDPEDADDPPAYQETLPQSINLVLGKNILLINSHEGWAYWMKNAHYQASFKTRKLRVLGFARALITTAGQTAYPVVENKSYIKITLGAVDPTGSATVTISGDNYLMTWDTDLQTTLGNFISDHEANILSNNSTSVFVNEKNELELDSLLINTITIANTTGDLDGEILLVPSVLIDSPDFEADENYDMFVEYDGNQLNTFFRKR